jgi:UDP-2,3-diacylglucosamine pyrophosphatase LpxH
MNSSTDLDDAVRSIFISDAHLGFRYTRADALLEFLSRHQPEHLFLVGDLIDGWRLRVRWFWPGVYSRIAERVQEMARHGTRVYYTPGNHDDFLRLDLPRPDWVKIADHFVHEAADGRRYLVTHGDLFDPVERRLRWLSAIGTRAYNGLMWLNQQLNRFRRRIGWRDWNFCFALKRVSKRMVGAFGRFERLLVAHARGLECDGVICGHVHFPQISSREDVLYCNTGDWVEHASALVELDDGSLQLVDRGRILKIVLPAFPGAVPRIVDRRRRRRMRLRPAKV